MSSRISKRFRETTRGQVVGLLRRGARTVEELAQSLGVTDNAIRAHLTALERDGLVRQSGVRRSPGAGKPAAVYELAPDVEVGLSHAYAPVLVALLEELSEQLPPERTEALLRAVGRRLAAGVPKREGTAEARARAAVALLNELGGDASLETEGGALVVRGSGCPLSAAVARRAETCGAVQSLLSEVIGSPVTQCCEGGARPRCCFRVTPAA